MEEWLNSTLLTNFRDEGKFPEVPVSLSNETVIKLAIVVLLVALVIIFLNKLIS